MIVWQNSYTSNLRGISFSILIFYISYVTCGTVPSSLSAEPALLIVSYDAFRPEYLTRNVTPAMNKFRKDGASAPYLMNVFPTKTYVNHHTIASGHYADKHGVLANEVYDSEQGQLGYSYKLFHYDESILPIWTANEKAGKHSGCMMWPGSDFKYDGTACTFNWKFDPSKEWKDRVDEVMRWFTHEKTPANLVMLYIEQPDALAHVYGPDSEKITDEVSQLDELTEYIQQQLIAKQLDKRVNVIHLSDHGMNSVSPPNFIDLRKFMADGTYTTYGSTPVLQIVPKDATIGKQLFANLTKAAKENGHFDVYNQETIPARYHNNNKRRLGPIVAVAHIKYGLQDMFDTAKAYEKKYNIPILPTTKYGVHGYDNQEKSMHAIFMAKGPLFTKGKKLKPFNSVDLYNLFCAILDIKCKKNDGNDQMDIWSDLLENTKSSAQGSSNTHKKDGINKVDIICVGAAVLIVIVIIVGYGLVKCFKSTTKKSSGVGVYLSQNINKIYGDDSQSLITDSDDGEQSTKPLMDRNYLT